jgi:hypothetical protein
VVAPFLVEITNQTDWWQPYVPPLVGFLGSVIVAGAAFVGVVKNNRTNQRAIDAADERSKDELKASRDRDFRNWQRDTLLRLSTEFVELVLQTQREYERIADSDIPPAAWVPSRDKTLANIASLRMIGAAQAAELCFQMSDLVYSDLYESVRNLNQIVEEINGTARSGVREAAKADYDALRSRIRDVRLQLIQSVQAELAKTDVTTR